MLDFDEFQQRSGNASCSNKEISNLMLIIVIWYCLDDLDLDASENLSCSKSDITALFDITTVRNNGRPRFYFNKLL